MGRFKKGLFLGGLLGASLMWLNVTPKGKEMRDKITAHIETLSNNLMASLKQLEGPTRDMYDALVERAVEEYAAKVELAEEVKVMLIRELKKKWTKLEKDLRKK